MQALLSRMETLDIKIGFIPLEDIARETGFFRRSARKACAREWLRAVCYLTTLPIRSYRTLAWVIGLIEGVSHSKQNVGKRMHAAFEHFLWEVLERIAGKLVRSYSRANPNLEGFKRVIIQDSTVIALPAHLAGRFPGSANQSGKINSAMRVQAFFDLISESCLGFSIGPFTRNDQKASSDIFDIAGKGDLVIRDLGYSSLGIFKRLKQEGIDLVSRLRYGIHIFNEDGEPIDLLAQLQRKESLDIPVRIGSEAKLHMRLIALPMPKAVAAERRRKARLNRDRRLNPSPQYMQLLGWQILVTTVSPERLTADDAIKIYSLRWRIETMFKAWKSHFNLGVVPVSASGTFICVLILAGLIYIALFQCLFQKLRYKNNSFYPAVSLLKFASLIQNLAAYELRNIIGKIPQANLLEMTLYHCRYDKRKRPNHFQMVADLSLIHLG